jgi:hypothetical protein
MILQERIELMGRLGQYMLGDSADWQDAKERGYRENPWFVPGFVEQSVKNIALNFLNTSFLQDWAKEYNVPGEQIRPKNRWARNGGKYSIGWLPRFPLRIHHRAQCGDENFFER